MTPPDNHRSRMEMAVRAALDRWQAQHELIKLGRMPSWSAIDHLPEIVDSTVTAYLSADGVYLRNAEQAQQDAEVQQIMVGALKIIELLDGPGYPQGTCAKIARETLNLVGAERL